MELATKKKHYRVSRGKISFIKFILEAYDNVASVTTIDPVAAVILVVIAPGCEKLVEDILKDLAKTLDIELLNDVDALCE